MDESGRTDGRGEPAPGRAASRGLRRAAFAGACALLTLLLATGVAAACRGPGGGAVTPRAPAHTTTARDARGGVPPSVLMDVCFADAEHGWIAALSGYVLRTWDGGATWTKTTIGDHFNLNSLSFSDDRHGFACGSWWKTLDTAEMGPAVFSTADGGASWTQTRILPGVIGELADVAAVDAQTATAVGATSQISPYSVVVRTSDGGASWQVQRHEAGRKVDILTGVAFLDADHGWASGYNAKTGHGVVLATSDGGATWTTQAAPKCAWLAKICFVDAQHGWACSYRSVLHTTDGGATWTKVLVSRGKDSDIEDVSFVDAQHGWAVGAGGTIWASSDGGDTWTAQRSGVRTVLQSVTALSPSDAWIVGEDDVVLKTGDGGATWVKGR